MQPRARGDESTQSAICTRTELWLGLGFVGLLTLVFFFPLLQGKTLSNIPSIQQLWAPWQALTTKPLFIFPEGDQATYVFPNVTLQTNAWRSGTIPFWNPFNFMGIPALANPSMGVMYPLRIVLALVVSPLANHDIYVVVHMFAAGFFMFLFLKELRVRVVAALLGATAWMFAGWHLPWMQLETFLACIAFLPAALLLIHRGCTRGSWRMATAAGVPLGLMTIGGNLQTAAVSFLICGAYAAALALVPTGRIRTWRELQPRRLLYPALAVGIGVGLSAIAILPTVIGLGEGGRSALTYPEYVQTRTISIDEFAHILTGGNPTVHDQFSAGVFVGAVPLFLAAIGFFCRRPGAAFGRWLTIVTFFVVIGAPGISRVAYLFVPGMSRLTSTGYVLWAFNLGVIILAVIGFEAVLGWLVRQAERLRVRQLQPMQVRRAVVGVVVVVVLGATAVQLIDYARYINPPFTDRSARSLLFPRTAALAALDRDRAQREPTEPQRYVGINALIGETNIIFGAENIGGYDVVVPARVRSLIRVLEGEPIDGALVGGSLSSFFTVFEPESTRIDLLERVGVTTVMTGPAEAKNVAATADARGVELSPVYEGRDATVFDVVGDQPRAWVVHEAEIVCDESAALHRFAAESFDHRQLMVVEPDQGLGSCDNVVQRGRGRGEIAESDPTALNDAGYTVEASSPGWLVMADTYAPGWSATVNGDAVDVLRADYTLRAVPVPAGRSRVELTYRPPGFVAGGVISVLTVIGLVGFVLVPYVRARRRADA